MSDSTALTKKTDLEERQLQYVGNIQTSSLTSYEPVDLKAAMDLCQLLCSGGLVPRDLQNKPGDVLTLIATGREYGLGWPAALQNLYVVHGRIGSYAEFQRARIMQHPSCEMFELVEASNQRAAIKLKKVTMDEPVVVEFTVEDAIQAGLMKRLESGKVVGDKGPDSNWSKYTSDMLVARVTTRAKRRYFPYVLTDLAAVEELRDLQEEKNVTPREDLAAERAETIVAAAGRPTPVKVAETPVPDSGATKAHAAAMAEKEVEPEAAEEASANEDASADISEEAVQRIPDALRKQLLQLDGIGPKVLLALEEGHCTNARAILAKGVSGLSKLSGIGKAKAEELVKWASTTIDETHRAEDLAEKEEAPAETAPETEDEAASEDEESTNEETGEPTVTFFRDAKYVQGLMALAEKHGVTKEQLRAQLDKLAEKVGLAPGIDPRALPDPQWVALQQWVQSGTQEALPLAGEAPEAAGPTTISSERVAQLRTTLRNLRNNTPEPRLAAWDEAFYAWLKQRFGINKIEDIPADDYLQVLGWLSENDPRS